MRPLKGALPMRAGITTLAALGLVLVAGTAAAQSFTYATEDDRKAAEEAKTKEDADKVEWKAGANAGLIITAGNSRITALSAGLTASRKQGANKLQLEGALAYARS